MQAKTGTGCGSGGGGFARAGRHISLSGDVLKDRQDILKGSKLTLNHP